MVKRILLLLSLLLAACQPVTPPPIAAVTGEEFTLAPGQSVTITDAGLMLTRSAYRAMGAVRLRSNAPKVVQSL